MGSAFPRLTYRDLLLALLLSWSSIAFAQEGRLSGTVTDPAGAAVVGATVDLINLASNAVRTTKVDATGKYEIPSLPAGQYRLVIRAPGYNDHGRTLTVESSLTEDVVMSVGNIKEVMTVTAMRGLAADEDVPLNVTTQTSQNIEEKLPVSPGEALKDTPSLFVFNSNSHLSSPNLRGLQSSRVQIVVDGERVNNSRTEIQTFGSNLGSFIDTFNIENVEVVAGSGSSLYGTDSLVGTVNFTTKTPLRPDQGWIFGAKMQGLYSTNETGRKGNVALNLSNPWLAINLSGSLFRFDNYHFGDPGGGGVVLSAVKLQQDFFKQLAGDNTSRQDFALTDDWHLRYTAFGVPVNGDRTTVYNSLSHGANGFFNLWLNPHKNHSLRYKQSNIHLGLYGYPNHAPPNYHDYQFASFDKIDRYGVRYQGLELNSFITRVAGGYFYQKLIRPIDNISFVSVLRAPLTNINDDPTQIQTIVRPSALTFNKQVVVTNGADAQVSLRTLPRNNLLVGYQFWRDRNADEFSSTLYNATAGTPGGSIPKFAPFAGYFLNSASAIYGKGVADSYNQENAFFFRDEYEPLRWLRLSLTYRYSRLTTKAFPADGFPLAGFDRVVDGPFPEGIVASGITGLGPLITKTGGTQTNHNVHTGSFSLIGRPRPEISIFGRVGNSLRLPALIEGLFYRVFPAGPFAFIFVPNAAVKPERGVNVDAGVKLNYRRFRAGLTYYNNTYTNFIEQTPPLRQDAVAGNPAANPAGRLGFQFVFFMQRLNTGRTRTHGLEAEYDVPWNLGRGGTINFSGIMSWQKGEDLQGDVLRRVQLQNLDRQFAFNQREGRPIFEFGDRTPSATTGDPAFFSDIPFERIVPFMSSATLRWQEPKGRFWSEYNIRSHTRIRRVDPDITANFIRFNYFTYRSLAGVSIHYLRFGYSRYGENSKMSFSVALDNLGDKFYTEPFQFAAARGRSVVFGFSLESFDLLKAFGK